MGPEVGNSRKEVLEKLLEVVETEIGRMLLNDGHHARKATKDGSRGAGFGS